ncbi:hypothetical protein DPMN_091138 [Dreissena polymorpha]|uniref:Uncharacterized protein n=1 Tax=Dreissena polymorpha TaxID=45954 RepID=A0A9D4QZP9_DREPO|nr:hypothetical protein DPMN_091138 [Dreissena polymorpha]
MHSYTQTDPGAPFLWGNPYAGSFPISALRLIQLRWFQSNLCAEVASRWSQKIDTNMSQEALWDSFEGRSAALSQF